MRSQIEYALAHPFLATSGHTWRVRDMSVTLTIMRPGGTAWTMSLRHAWRRPGIKSWVPLTRWTPAMMREANAYQTYVLGLCGLGEAEPFIPDDWQETARRVGPPIALTFRKALTADELRRVEVLERAG